MIDERCASGGFMLNLRHSALVLAFVVAGGMLSGHAQAIPTATHGGILQVGAGFSTSKTDLMDVGNKNIQGLTIYSSFDLVNLGLEADLHFTNIVTPKDFGENSFLLGPRYVFRLGRFEPYVKVQAGLGQVRNDEPWIHIQGAPDSYFAYAFGGD